MPIYSPIRKSHSRFKKVNSDNRAMPYATYNGVINLYYLTVANAIIEEGLEYHIEDLSTIYVKHVEFNYSKLRVDYGASNKLKQEILDKGGVPYENYKDDNGKIVGNNGGENWLVYYNEDDTWAISIKRNGYRNDNFLIVNDKRYELEAVRACNRKLAKYIKGNPNNTYIYEKVSKF